LILIFFTITNIRASEIDEDEDASFDDASHRSEGEPQFIHASLPASPAARRIDHKPVKPILRLGKCKKIIFSTKFILEKF